MERRPNNSGPSRRRYEEQSMYQLQPPPISQPQQQQNYQDTFIISQQQQSYNQGQKVIHYRGDLQALADKLGVKNGGLPSGRIEMNKSRTRFNGSHDVGTASNTGEKTSKQLGVKLVQRGFKFSESQRNRLNEAFLLNRYPKPEEMMLLAYEINARKDQVKNWFHDQRRKYKKETTVAKTSRKTPTFTAQQRRKLEEFFEKNFHPYPGDSKRLVDEFESSDGRVHFRYEVEPIRCESGEKNLKSRGFKFSEDQRNRLRSFFDCNRYPNPQDMNELAQELDVKREQVKNWFHDQRRKLKRENSLR